MNIPTPHNVEAERSVIGSCLIDYEAAVMMLATLKDTDFWCDDCRVVFGAISAVMARDERPDLVTVHDALDAAGQLDDVGPANLRSMAAEPPSSANVEYYGRVVQKHSQLRKVVGAAASIIEAAHNGADLDELRALANPLDVAGPTESPELMKDVLERLWHSYEHPEERPIIKTGLDLLDDALDGGLYEGDMTVLGARPKEGKSSIGCYIARVAAKAGHKVLFVTREMTKESLASRMVAAEAGVNSRAIRRGDRGEINKIIGGFDGLRSLPIEFSRASSPAEIRPLVGASKLVIVDYFNMLQFPPGKDLQYTIMGRYVDEFYRMAKKMRVHILLIAQLSRGKEHRDGKTTLALPKKSDFHDCPKLEQVPDTIIALHRPNGDGTPEVWMKMWQRHGPSKLLTGITADDARMQWSSEYLTATR